MHSAYFLLISLARGTLSMPDTGQAMVKAPCPEKSIPELFQNLLSVWGVFELQAQ